MNRINFAGIEGEVKSVSPHGNYTVVKLSDRITIVGTFSNRFHWEESPDSGFKSFITYIGLKSYSEYQNLANLNRYSTLGKTTGPQYSDATLTILSSSNIPLYRFKFYEVFPTSISSFSMSSTDTPDNIITADATFRYTYYDIDKL